MFFILKYIKIIFCLKKIFLAWNNTKTYKNYFLKKLNFEKHSCKRWSQQSILKKRNNISRKFDQMKA